MKAFATKATLMADGDSVKVYEIEYVDKHGREQKVTAKGRGMRDALNTVIKQDRMDRLKRVPMGVWLLLTLLAVAGFVVTAIHSGAPLLTLIGGIFGFSALYQFLNKYFKYTE